MAEENQSLGFLSLKNQCIALLAFLIVADIAEEHRITLPVRRVLDTLDDQREERIRDIRYRHEQLAGPECAQAPGRSIRRVAQCLDGALDLAAGDFRYDIRVTQGTRNRGGGYSRRARHLL